MTNNGSYVFDAENRLVWTSGYRYIYDGNGQRVEKCQAASATTACPTSGTTGTLYWRGTGSDTLAETDLGGSQQEEYIFFSGQRIARRDVSSTGATIGLHYYFSDHLGSYGLVETVTTTGTTSCDQDIDYYPYGGVEHDYCPNVAQNYKFTGKERDSESGLDNFGARHHASSLGRFMTPDWAARPTAIPYALLGDPQSFNLYAYVRNKPLTWVDRDGHEGFHFCSKFGNAVCGDGSKSEQAQDTRSILGVAGESNASLAVKTSTTSTTNKDGTVTLTTTTTIAAFSARDGNLGQFLGAATQTNTMTYNPEDSFTINPGQNGPITPISLDAARKTIGYDEVRQAASVSPDLAYHFVRALGSDMYHHPINYALHAAGFALPFLEVGEAAEGLITGAEALKTAIDLNKEMQRGNQ